MCYFPSYSKRFFETSQFFYRQFIGNSVKFENTVITNLVSTCTKVKQITASNLRSTEQFRSTFASVDLRSKRKENDEAWVVQAILEVQAVLRANDGSEDGGDLESECAHGAAGGWHPDGRERGEDCSARFGWSRGKKIPTLGSWSLTFFCQIW